MRLKFRLGVRLKKAIKYASPDRDKRIDITSTKKTAVMCKRRTSFHKNLIFIFLYWVVIGAKSGNITTNGKSYVTAMFRKL